MTPEFKAYLDTHRAERATLLEAAKLLPADDAELDRWIGETVDTSQARAFFWMVMGALAVERAVDARHLARGAAYSTDPVFLGCMAYKMKGDIVAPLMEAATRAFLPQQIAVGALLVVACWCREHRGSQWPEQLIPQARWWARNKGLTEDPELHLRALAEVTQDAGLRAVLATRGGNVPVKLLVELVDLELKTWRTPVLELITENPTFRIAAGVTMRRAVAKVGRNDPCPCGSGRKHKQCCEAKDRERLRLSSPVAGCTSSELWADPERHLTSSLLEQMGRDELARLAPEKIAPELRLTYLKRVGAVWLYERAAELFEKLGCAEEWAAEWVALIRSATLVGRKDIIRRLQDARGGAVALDWAFQLATRLLLLEDEPAVLLPELEALALKMLQTEDMDGTGALGMSLMSTKYRALGILITRNAIPLMPKQTASNLYERILHARDRLNLTPEDPFGDLLDRRFLEHIKEDEHDAEALRTAQQRLEEKAKEVQALKESLGHLHREVDRRQEAASAPAQAATPAPAAEEAALKELRERVEKFKTALKERHEERNELRRELQQVHADLEALRQRAPAPTGAEPAEADPEADLLLPEEAAVAQPVRTIDFPKGFQEKLASLPRAVARGTLTTLGRVAAGEPSAFVGAVRLKACGSVMRLRVGGDFRLLFRLLPEEVQVLDLIPRQDLARRIKTLLRTAYAA